MIFRFNNTSNPKFRTGKRTFRLTSSSTNTLTGDVFTSAEADYTAKGLVQQVQETVVSTREAQIQRENVQETVINRQDVRVVRTTEVDNLHQQIEIL